MNPTKCHQRHSDLFSSFSSVHVSKNGNRGHRTLNFWNPDPSPAERNFDPHQPSYQAIRQSVQSQGTLVSNDQPMAELHL